MKIWILTAHRSGARIYTHNKPGSGLTLLRDIPHEEGRLKDGEINSDQAGRTQGHSMEREEAPSERVAADFARSLARDLDKDRAKGSFDEVVLVAAPQMLGLIRKSLSSATAAKVSGSIDKEYLEKDQDKLEKALGQFFRV